MKVAWLHVAPVKGLRIDERDRIELGPNGVADDRLFCVVDETGRLVNGKRLAPLSTIVARYDAKSEQLELRMSNGSAVNGTVAVAAPIAVTIYGHTAPGHVVYGPWADALSDELGRPVDLVRLDGPGQGHDRASKAAGATLLSTASLERMQQEAASTEPVDARRFRMLIGVSGTNAHEEDEWIGRRVHVGDAVVVPSGNVGRCVVTTRDPDTAEPTLDTLELLARYRRDIGTTEELAFGVWARVEQPGTVRVGDEVEVEP
ncbi:MAG TPA: MOSC domain-containing protein [Candidatus Limnocylindria bacterium]|jgi:uncharacterized protein YcbX